jgi:hypothetical protein
MQEILYNSKLDKEAQDKHRGALHEIDQLLLLPQSAKAYYQMKEQGLKAVDSNGPQVASNKGLN